MSPSESRRRRWPLVIAVVIVACAGVAFAAGQMWTQMWTGPGLPGLFSAAPQPVGAEPVDIADGAAGPASNTGERQAALVAAEDNRIFDVVGETRLGQDPFEVATAGLPTLVLPAVPRPYELVDLQRNGAVERLPDGTWLLRRSVVVTRGAELRLRIPGGTLRMSSGPEGFAALVGFKGALTLAGEPGAPLRITSWNPATRMPDTDLADGRAYIRTVGGRMDLAQSEISHLGFWSGRTSGVAWTGGNGGPSTGSANAVLVQRGHYGMFSSRSDGLAVTYCTFRDNELDGLLLHRDTTGFVARAVTSTGNGRDGIAALRGARALTLAEVTASSNAGDGIRIDGSPLAVGPTADGVSTLRGAGYTIERSSVAGNRGVGVLVRGADGVRIAGNTVTGNRDGIVVQGPALRPEVIDNAVDGAEFGIAVRDGSQDAQIASNRVGAAVVGVQVVDASAAVRSNTVTAATHYGVSLVGEVSNSTVRSNVLSGRGLKAVDRSRSSLATAVRSVADDVVSANDDNGWITDRDEIQYWRGYIADHPLLLLWLLILLLPVVARLWFTRRRKIRNRRRHPYHNATPSPVVTNEPAYESLQVKNGTRVSVLSDRDKQR